MDGKLISNQGSLVVRFQSTQIGLGGKVSSVQEACTKCFAVHLLKFDKLANHMKKQSKKHQNAKSIGEKLETKGLRFFVSFFSCDLQDFKF